MTSKLKSNQGAALAQAAAAAMAVVAGTASAQVLYGGGAPTSAYAGPPSVSAPSAGSLFGVFDTAHPGTVIHYCQTGSGTGRRVLEGLVDARGSCGSTSFPMKPSSGFGAVNSLPDFAASDEPLGPSDIAADVTDLGFVETPTIGSVVSLIYNQPRAGASTPSLSSGEICEIFSGQLTEWSQLSGSGFSSGPITVVYFSDRSGTTFAFSNWLSHNCNVSGSTPVFQTSQNYTGGVTPVLASLPANFVGADGNAAVVSSVTSMAGSIGYAETADAVAIEGASFPHFEVNGLDPVSDAPATLNVTALVNEGLAPTNSPRGQPMLATLSVPSECVFMLDPNTLVSTSITSDDGAVGVIPDFQYPLVGVTYLLGYQTGNVSGHAPLLQSLFSIVAESSSLRSSVTIVTPANGFMWLSLDLSSSMSACIGD